jgi:hypothetical protein
VVFENGREVLFVQMDYMCSTNGLVGEILLGEKAEGC